MIDSATRRRPTAASLLLQGSHRLATVGLLALLGTVGLLYVDRDIYAAVTAAAAVAVLGAAAALLAATARPRSAAVLVGVIAAVGAAGWLALGGHGLFASIGTVLGGCVVAAGLTTLAFTYTAESDGRSTWREAAAAFVFNLVLATAAFCLLARDSSDTVRDDLHAFLTPPATLPRQP